MAYEFKKISEVEIMDEVLSEATVLGVSGGQVVQMPSSGLINPTQSLPIFIQDEMSREQMIQLAKDQTIHICLNGVSEESGYQKNGIVLSYHAAEYEGYEDEHDPCSNPIHTYTLQALGVCTIGDTFSREVWQIELDENEYNELSDILSIYGGA